MPIQLIHIEVADALSALVSENLDKPHSIYEGLWKYIGEIHHSGSTEELRWEIRLVDDMENESRQYRLAVPLRANVFNGEQILTYSRQEMLKHVYHQLRSYHPRCPVVRDTFAGQILYLSKYTVLELQNSADICFQKFMLFQLYPKMSTPIIREHRSLFKLLELPINLDNEIYFSSGKYIIPTKVKANTTRAASAVLAVSEYNCKTQRLQQEMRFNNRALNFCYQKIQHRVFKARQFMGRLSRYAFQRDSAQDSLALISTDAANRCFAVTINHRKISDKFIKSYTEHLAAERVLHFTELASTSGNMNSCGAVYDFEGRDIVSECCNTPINSFDDEITLGPDKPKRTFSTTRKDLNQKKVYRHGTL